METFAVILGVLAAIAVLLFLMSRVLGGPQSAWVQSDERARAQVEDRIRPIGRLVTDPDQLDLPVQVADVPQPTDDPDTTTAMSGADVYTSACGTCHTQGIAGAPATGDVEGWTARIAQGMDILYQHSIEGFLGEAGYMPPKGGRLDLSDDEVRAAVDYMVERSGG